jgi:hypothetical protein
MVNTRNQFETLQFLLPIRNSCYGKTATEEPGRIGGVTAR